MAGAQSSQLLESTSLIGDHAAMEERYHEHGYLFFRQVLPVDAVGQVRDAVLGGLAAQGIRQTGATPDAISMKTRREIDEAAVNAAVPFEALFEHPQTLSLFKAILNEEDIFVFRGIIVRIMAPHDDALATALHQDAFFVRDCGAFRTVWVPLVGITPDMGSLGIWPGSHKAGVLLPTIPSPDKISSALGIPFPTVAPQALRGDPLVVAPVEPGDVIIFHPFIVHGAMPNVSTEGRTRLSIDTRFQRAEEPRSVGATKSFSELVKQPLNREGVFVEQ